MVTVLAPDSVDYKWQVSKPNVLRLHADHSSTELKSLITGHPVVLVAIPCYNEEISIGSILLRASKYADRMVVIDDGSTDRTAEIALMVGAEVIVHEKNEGKGVGIRDAFGYQGGPDQRAL